MANITSANAVYILTIPGLYDSGVQIQQFSADDMFDTEALDSAETQMGVDGHFTAGFVYVPLRQSITLMADSNSVDVFETWYGAQQTSRSLYEANGTIVLSSVGKTYTLTRGFLTGYAPLPDAKRTLQARKFGITWQKVTSAIS